jgi:uncharacterized protein YyaL (SSP411 family)
VNRLADQTSPYLLQHKDNPVDWYPWGDDAFRRARLEDRPILLSVGYSACHWCHVMAHESFENPDLAELQNRLFVSIKVDREERPDVDRVYMDALQALNGSGGWPMTVFLLPDGRPFYAGTYFPPQDRGGLPGFGRLMQSLARAYRDRRSEVLQTADKLAQALVPAPLVSVPPSGVRLNSVLAAAEARLLRSADPDHGGLGGAPKFPQCALLEFLLARDAVSPGEGRQVVEQALAGMAEGGIRDQLGGGFHRYSVDERWAVPHFEQMLYDNAQLVRLCLHAWQAYGNPRHLELARSTADFLLRDMQLPAGGFAASFDADTAEGEGAYYVWTEAQLQAALGTERAGLARRIFSGPGEAMTSEGGLVLRGGDLGPVAAGLGTSESELRSLRQSMVGELAEARARRIAPGRDEKLVVGWNALAISALAELATATEEPTYLEAARHAAEAILTRARAEGRLQHLFDGARARFTATLDDLAGMGLASLTLHEVTGEPGWFELATELARLIERDYRDPSGPGWFDTPLAHDPNLQARPRTIEDGAQPSGVSLAAELCLRLHALSGDATMHDRALQVVTALSSAAERFPAAFGALLSVMQLLDTGQTELALLVPDLEGAHWPLLRSARGSFRPHLVVGVGRIPEGASQAQVGPPLVRSRGLLDGLPTAYVCREFTCRRPLTERDQLDQELDRG